MFPVDTLILVAGILLALGIVSSKFSARLGLPVLVLFLVVGMLAGSEGFGGIAFENYTLAHGIGTVALAIILFDGGLRTPFSGFRIAWKPSLLLATVGVLMTAGITGFAASAILGIPLLEGLLIGSIVASTDAAAVFALLRSAGVHLKKRISATLEIESGSNDPMAIFLTIALIETMQGRVESGWELFQLFALQMGVGTVVGFAVGVLAVRAINRINLEAAGLYPVFTGAFGMLAFGIAASLAGSGFLAIYIAGIVIGNSRVVFHRGTLVFHDGIAWAGQITMFVMLGLLSFPSALLDVAGPGLLVAAILIFLARPLAIAPLLLVFRFSIREIAMVSWVGLKGAVPIILATYPLIFGLDRGPLIFNIVFFTVLVSAILQGSTVPWIARKLDLEEPPESTPPITLEITSLRDVNADIVEYTVGDRSRVAGKRLNQVALPEGVVVAMIARGDDLIPPRGSTQIRVADHVFVVLRPDTRPLVDRAFGRDPILHRELPHLVEFPLIGETTLRDLFEFYGIQLEGDDDKTLDEVIRDRLGEATRVDSTIAVGGFTLHVREMVEGRVSTVGLAIPRQVHPGEDLVAPSAGHD